MSYQRSKEDERRLKKTYEMTKNSYGPGVWYSERKNRYIKANFTNKQLKTMTSRVTRRKLKNESCTYEKGFYKKFFDYWWELY